MSQEVQVAQITTLGGGSGSSSGGGSFLVVATSTSGSATMLSSKVEQVHIAVVTTLGSGSGSSTRTRGGSGLTLLLLLLNVVGDSLSSECQRSHCVVARWTILLTYIQEILNGAIGVVEGSTHGSLNRRLLETHGLHVSNGLGARVAHGQS